MGIDSIDFDEGAEAGTSSAPEKVSEKSREQSSKTLAGIAKGRKDEAKGRKASTLLFWVLAKILREPKFDPVIEPVFLLLQLDIPSAQILGLLSIISTEAANALRREYDPKAPMIQIEPLPEKEHSQFDPHRIRPDLKNRINDWIEDIFRISTKDPSSVLTEKFLGIVSDRKGQKAFIDAGTAVLIFFFASKNYTIPPVEAEALSNYLLSELRKRLAELEMEKV